MTVAVFLIGARGCGKTTIGERLARACQFQFVDTDWLLQQQAQMSVADIVAREGWEGFRARETATLQAVACPATVVATGGGIVLAPHNRQFMRERGVVVYLRASASVLAERLAAEPQNSQRPTLTGKPISEEVREVLAQRDALYLATAHHVVDASGAPEAVAAAIFSALRPAAAS